MFEGGVVLGDKGGTGATGRTWSESSISGGGRNKGWVREATLASVAAAVAAF